MFSLLKYSSKNQPLLRRSGLTLGLLSLAGIAFILDSCSTVTPLKGEIQYRPPQGNNSKIQPAPAQEEKQNASSNKMASLPNTSLTPSDPPVDKAGSHPAPLNLPSAVQDDMDWKSLEQVIQNQLAVMEDQNELEPITLEGLNLTKGDLKNSLNAFLDLLRQNLEPDKFNLRVRREFTFYKAGQGADKKFLFTGYYTPVIPASPVRTEEYIYPIYRLPDDSPELNFINLAPSENSKNETRPNWKNFTREQIDRHHVLKNQHLEIAWLKDDLERFFLHIQGSALLRFPNGKLQSVGYAGANKYGYKGIGKLMVKDGLLGKGERSMQGIKKYLRNNPEKIPIYLYQNKRYIFFSYNDNGPLGSGGGTLVGGRSLATDKSIYPAGGLALIFVRKPVLDQDDNITSWKRTFRFVVDQDTGSDIKGPGRADLFFGIGQRPGIMAGGFKEWGEVYYLIKKN
jgi:membrane-bound lytic murein transglycosylase A